MKTKIVMPLGIMSGVITTMTHYTTLVMMKIVQMYWMSKILKTNCWTAAWFPIKVAMQRNIIPEQIKRDTVGTRDNTSTCSDDLTQYIVCLDGIPKDKVFLNSLVQSIVEDIQFLEISP